jgi:hypothetical protein
MILLILIRACSRFFVNLKLRNRVEIALKRMRLTIIKRKRYEYIGTCCTHMNVKDKCKSALKRTSHEY